MLTVSFWNQITTEFFGNVAAARRMAFNSHRLSSGIQLWIVGVHHRSFLLLQKPHGAASKCRKRLQIRSSKRLPADLDCRRFATTLYKS
jgi:hypothetical protein